MTAGVKRVMSCGLHISSFIFVVGVFVHALLNVEKWREVEEENLELKRYYEQQKKTVNSDVSKLESDFADASQIITNNLQELVASSNQMLKTFRQNLINLQDDIVNVETKKETFRENVIKVNTSMEEDAKSLRAEFHKLEDEIKKINDTRRG